LLGELLGQFLLSLAVGEQLFVFIPEYLVEPQQFLVEEGEFVLVVVNGVLVVPQLHYSYLVLLHLLLVVLYLSVAVIVQLT
jgi:hypothetical protein